MAEVIGVRFKEVGKVYYFDPLDNKLSVGDRVIVETARGLECGEVAVSNKSVSDEDVKQPLKPLIRIATEKDLNHVAENHLREKEAYKICEKKIAAHKLEMKLVNVATWNTPLTTARSSFISPPTEELTSALW